MAMHGSRAAMRLQRQSTQLRMQQNSMAAAFNASSNGGSPAASTQYEALPAGMRRRVASTSEHDAAADSDVGEQDSVHSQDSTFSVCSEEELGPEEAEAKAVHEARIAALGSVDDALLASGLQNLQVDSASKGKRQTISRTRETEETIINNVLQVIKDSQAGKYILSSM